MMIAWILIAVVLILIGASTVQLARTNRTATRKGSGVRDRGEALTSITADIALLVVARAMVDWTDVPWFLWLVGLALTATAVLLAGLAWSRLPWISSGRRSLRLASATTQVAVAVALTAVLL
jgi:hypothetical protein